MSRSGLEKALYDIIAGKQARESFLADSSGFLDRYRLDPQERADLGEVDLPALRERGANPMLLWGMWMTFGDRTMSGYLSELRGGRTLSIRKDRDNG
ncbi:hypothetical protein D5S18_26745 [Nocardia panacis]|uniref:Extradiol ring-cleavage dioxygenase LigAB LigA subunit domain-containing protein n=1 Tax=Nocardia panacis TaxID=2340916 RepID=A0A3A4KD61_9NOCA|nr:hypothetical protein [Nocardia panacis]RJO70795.1 hypothetical protein D5S18_26745 [Nocardia panacis]